MLMLLSTLGLLGALGTPAWGSVHQQHALDPPPMGVGVHRPAPPDTPSPERWVYGYYAYWAGELTDVDWARLSHVAVFAVDMNVDGTFSGGSLWSSLGPQAVALGAPHGTKVHLTLTCFDDDVMTAVLTSSERRAILVEALGAAVDSAGAHGVSVDCEGVPGELRDPLTTFVIELQERVDEVTIATPAIDWSDAFDKAALSEHADAIFIMGYGYHWSGGNPGPIAPLVGGAPWSNWSLSDTVETYVEEGADPARLILGLPLYGRTWPTTDNSVPGTATESGSAVTMVNAISLAATHGRQYDTVTDTPYTFISSTSQTWYDDTDSLQLKIRWAVARGLGGIGFWALNYEAGDPDFWQMITTETTGLDPDEPVEDTAVDGDTAVADDSAAGGDTAARPQTGSDTSADSASPEDVVEPRGINFSSAPVRCGSVALIPLGLLGLAVARRRRSQDAM